MKFRQPLFYARSVILGAERRFAPWKLLPNSFVTRITKLLEIRQTAFGKASNSFLETKRERKNRKWRREVVIAPDGQTHKKRIER